MVNLSSNSFQEKFAFQFVSVNPEIGSKPLGLAEWIHQNEFIQIDVQKIIEEHLQRVQEITFHLEGDAKGLDPLFRGLISSGHTPFLYIQAQPSARIFTLCFTLGEEERVKAHLERLFTIIRKEIRFKKVLRKVLVNKEKFQREEKLLFKEMTA